MTKLSKEMTGATTGSKKSVAAIQQLGVSMADVRSGDTQKVIMEVSDGLAKMTNPATRAALAQQLFGRTGSKLAPILFKGSGAIQQQLDLVNKYGDTLDTKTAKGVAKTIADQREMGIAMQGVKVKLGTALLPVLLALSSVLVAIVRVMQPLLTSSTALKIVFGTLAVARIAYKATLIVTTIAENLFNVSLGVTQVLITGGVIVAILALIAVGYELYKHWGDLQKLAGEVWAAIKDGAQAAIDWLKQNWPLVLGILAGPFGLAVAAIATHWTQIKKGVSDAFNAVKTTITNAVAPITNAAKSIATKIWEGIVGGLAGIGNAAWSVINNIWDAIQNQARTIVGWGTSLASWLKNAVVSGLLGIGDAAWSVINNIWDAIQRAYKAIVGWGTSVGSWLKSGVVAGFEGIGALITAAIKNGINVALRAWNALKIPGFHVKVLGKSVGAGGIDLPNLP